MKNPDFPGYGFVEMVFSTLWYRIMVPSLWALVVSVIIALVVRYTFKSERAMKITFFVSLVVGVFFCVR